MNTERWELPDFLFVFSPVVWTHWKEDGMIFSAGGKGEVLCVSVCVMDRGEMSRQQGCLLS